MTILLARSVATLVKPLRDPHTVSKVAVHVSQNQSRLAWYEMKAMVQRFEGFYPHAYRCPAGVRTIGYGFTDSASLRHGKISKERARVILENKLRNVEASVEKIVHVPLTPYQKAALTSFTYNCGPHNLKRLVNGAGRLNSGNYDSVQRLLPLYTSGGGKKLGGLVDRRHAEVKLWKKG